MSKQRRIVVTGATGLIGSRLVRQLTERGDSVVALVRDTARARERVPAGVELVRWSHDSTADEWQRHIDGADAIVNLAGATVGQRWTDSQKRRIRESRVAGTRHLVDAIRDASRRPSVLVNASAVGCYGVKPAGTVTESSPPGDDFLAQVCQEWEAEASRAIDYGVRVAFVRSGIVLDPNGGALKRLLLPFRMFVGGPIGSGDQPMPWVHIDDDVRMFLWALDDESVSGPLNATAPDVRSNRDFSRELGRALGRPSALPVPEFVLRLILGEGAEIVTGGQWVLSERAQALGFRFDHTNLGEALQSLLG